LEGDVALAMFVDTVDTSTDPTPTNGTSLVTSFTPANSIGASWKVVDSDGASDTLTCLSTANRADSITFRNVVTVSQATITPFSATSSVAVPAKTISDPRSWVAILIAHSADLTAIDSGVFTMETTTGAPRMTFGYVGPVSSFAGGTLSWSGRVTGKVVSCVLE
jgi:hypothetical protein